MFYRALDPPPLSLWVLFRYLALCLSAITPLNVFWEQETAVSGKLLSISLSTYVSHSASPSGPSASEAAAIMQDNSEIHTHVMLLVQFQELVLLDRFPQILPNTVNQVPQIDTVTQIKSILLCKSEISISFNNQLI